MRAIYQPVANNLPSSFSNVQNPHGVRQSPADATSQGAAELVPANAVDDLLAPLFDRAGHQGSPLRFSPVGDFHHGTQRFRLPRFIFQGPPAGGSYLRLGLFAAIHGDEPEGALALRDFLLQLADDPSLARGYAIYAYPVCNPSGLEDGTRHSRAGRDLNREFWQGSTQPEVYFLERELGVQQFAGLVALHSDDTSEGAYAFVRGATLTEALAKPALAAAARFLPLAEGELIYGLPARASQISECYQGVLSNPAELKPLPFEIIFETPQSFPTDQQAAAGAAALLAIMQAYREFIAYGQNI